MCTYATEVIGVRASAKGAEGWFAATRASVYYDHPTHLPDGHALIVDVLDASGRRAALELDAPSARRLARAIVAALESVPAPLLEAGGRD